jgi:hypothetical protein
MCCYDYAYSFLCIVARSASQAKRSSASRYLSKDNIMRNRIESIIKTYCIGYINDILKPPIIEKMCKDNMRDIIVQSPVKNTLIEQSKEYIEQRMSERDIENMVSSASQRFLQKCLTNCRTFAEILEYGKTPLGIETEIMFAQPKPEIK